MCASFDLGVVMGLRWRRLNQIREAKCFAALPQAVQRQLELAAAELHHVSPI